MSTLPQLYRHSLALLTDLYQLTMAYGYWKTGVAEREAVFHLTFRTCPFGGAYAVACGLSYVVDWLRDLRFDQDDLRYLATLTGADDRPLFDAAFLDQLAGMQFRCDVDAVPEGTVVFSHEPLVRVRGPILQAQLLETALLTIVNFQTLVATKAARLCGETPGDVVIEFGLRRAQGIDGGISASRAAFVGGCAATSNVLAGKLFGIPIKGTHAHSWVMSFDSELESFRAYAAALPNNCVFLVDTYDTLQGVRHAVEVGRRLREEGHEMLGIRLDSGDLAELSIAARQILDDGGFPNAAIVASNDLDEYLIRDLKYQGATITVWGVGTRLATAYDQPALGGIYKLSAIRASAGDRWQHKIKLSEQPIKVSTPGILQVRRFSNDDGFLADVIYDELTGIAESPTAVDFDGHVRRRIVSSARHEDLLVPVFRQGKPVYNVPTAAEAQQRAKQQLQQLPDATKRLHNPTPYSVGLEENLYLLKSRLIDEARNNPT